jgi:hypothetical protein
MRQGSTLGENDGPGEVASPGDCFDGSVRLPGMESAMKPRLYVGLAAVLAMALAGCSTENVADLGPGDCFNVSLSGESQEIGQVPTVECSKEHTAEVFMVADLPDSSGMSYDLDEIFNRGADLCIDEFERYVGIDFYDPAVFDLDISVVHPLEEEWKQGVRSITCLIIPVDISEKLTGSQKNAFAAG